MEFHQESNSFCPVKTVFDDYSRCSVLEGENIFKKVRGKKLALAAMLDALDEAGITIVPGYAMRAPAGGIVEHVVVEHFLQKMEKAISDNMPLDGAFFSMHGATQSTQVDDVCGSILQKARKLLGKKAVISVSCDLHANVTDLMFKNADFICGYLTYPHMDIYETGYRAAKLGIRKLQGDNNLHMAWTRLPMILPACGYSTESDELGEIMQNLKNLKQNGVLEDYSVFQMQPWLDVSNGGSAIIAIARDQDTAMHYAKETAQSVWEIRDFMKPKLHDLEEVIELAKTCKVDKPLVVIDFSDSTNAGAAGDNFDIAAYILNNAGNLKTATVINDAPIVEKAFSAGVGAVLDTYIGGSRDKKRSTPVKVKAIVCSLHDGKFLLEGPSMRRVNCNIGRTAVLSIGNIDVVACTAMASTGDPQLFRHFGIEPTFYQIVIVKANNSYRPAYEKIADRICLVDTHCAATSFLETLPFKKLPGFFHPFSKSAFPEEFRVVLSK